MFKKAFLVLLVLFFAASSFAYAQEQANPPAQGEDLLKTLDESKKEAKEIKPAEEVNPAETPAASAAPAEEAKEEAGQEAKAQEQPQEKPKEAVTGGEKPSPEKKREGKAELLSGAIYGQTGLFRTYSAQRQPHGLSSIGLSMHGEWFNQNNFITVGDEVSRIAWTAAMTYAPVSFTEIFAAISGFTNTGESATVFQRMGDIRTGIKLGFDLSRTISLGTNFQAEILQGAGDINIAANSYSYDLRALLTFDFMKSSEIPIRLHFNAGYRWDGTDQPAGIAGINRTEQFFLNVLYWNQITFGVGFEVPIKFISLFAEYTSEQIWDLSYENSPQRITAGLKLYPTSDQAISFDFGTDIRVMNSDRNTRAIGIPAYNMIFGMTMARYPAKKVELPPPAAGTLSGAVIDAEMQNALGGAQITIDDGIQNTIISKDGTGAYSTCELTGGTHKISVVKEGYEPLTVEAAVVPGQSSAFDLAMTKKKLEKGSITFQIFNADDKPVSGSVSFLDYPNLKPYVVDTARGGLKVKLKAGSFRVRVSADKFASEEKVVAAEAGKDITDKTILRELMAKIQLMVDKILIKDTIHFTTGKAEILTDSLSLLNRVADMIDDHKEIKKIRIEGHTDSTGGDELNMKLSQDRAAAVKEYMLIRGISADRLESVGYGETKPLATNSTKQGRAINRRVEFFIANE